LKVIRVNGSLPPAAGDYASVAFFIWRTQPTTTRPNLASAASEKWEPFSPHYGFMESSTHAW